MGEVGATLIAAFGLMLVFEGAMPLLLPRTWREAFRRLIDLRDGQLRFLGLAFVVAGLVVVSLAA